MVIAKREVGSLEPKPQGHGGIANKLGDHHDWLAKRVAQNGDTTLHELCFELIQRGVSVYPSTVMRALHRLGLSHKKAY